MTHRPHAQRAAERTGSRPELATPHKSHAAVPACPQRTKEVKRFASESQHTIQPNKDLLTFSSNLHILNPTSKMCNKNGQRTDNLQALTNKDKNSLTEFTTVNVHSTTLTHAVIITITIMIFFVLLVFALKYWYKTCTAQRGPVTTGEYITSGHSRRFSSFRGRPAHRIQTVHFENKPTGRENRARQFEEQTIRVE